MGPEHKKYLTERLYFPETLEKEWGLKGVRHLGPYKWRIIAPIHYKGVRVSYQGRDITGKSDLRYKACVIEDETRHHKFCLYGLDKVIGKRVVVVEGITGVWRLGPGAVATFGIAWTQAQALLLQRFPEVFILFDPGEEAQRQANELGNQLSLNGQKVEIVQIDDDDLDPGDLPQDEADDFMRQLFERR
jgi:DNA primase